ncbi:MAG TPA: hypothetical protein VFB78_16865 [Acidimicrobiales bacterium]|nr:hypothetical protein [Acidimicrobiales bacterium]
MTRLLAIMGSGETSPTMVKTHRALFEHLGPNTSAVLLDTPFGFQENASDIAAKAVEYFATSVGRSIDVACLRTSDIDALARESAVEQVRAADYVFSGPGSPSYALRQWRDTPIPELLRAKLRDGGCVCFASAAALTLGLVTVPVYEVYKVGEDPVWLEGLDLLGATGLRAAVIPHFDNAEGGNHDTRFCYLGERRLRILEASLPDDAFVLGVDEHTACVLDLDAGTAAVTGNGGVTIRRDGEARVVPAGTTVSIDELAEGGGATVSAAPPTAAAAVREARSPLLDSAARLEADAGTALATGDLAGAVNAVLTLDDELAAWSADTLQSDEPDRVKAVLRSMLVRLAGEAGAVGQRAELVGPLVEALLDARAAARDGGRFDEADAVRDQLVALGIEVNDSREGSSWRLLS